MPVTGQVTTLDKGRQEYPHNGYLTTFSHKNESAKPGYYSVKMDNGVAVELTASERVGFHQYRFPKGKEAHLIIDLKEGINDRTTDSYLEQVDDYTLKGYRFSSGWAKEQQVFFAIRSSKPIKLTVYNEDKPLTGKTGKGTSVKGVVDFNAGDFVQLKVGISPVSADNALSNINAEIPDWNFSKVMKQADEKWNKELSRIEVQTKNEADKRIFYTALFHSMAHPSLFNDHNGDYQGADNKVHTNPGFNNYTIFSTWDTYRAEHPLFTLIAPNRMSDFVNTMLAIFDEQGYLPIWHLNGYETGTMVGISSLQIIAEAYLKGFRGFDAERAFAAMKATAMSDLRGLNYVQKLQPIPSDARIGRPVANALELAIGDGSIALMAKAMGKTEDYEYFKKRAENYRLYFDAESGFFRGKMADGSWNPNFDPMKSTRPWSRDYTEGNAWQYLWLVPQDVPGLIKLLGGEKAFTDKLDKFFSLKSEATEEVLVDLTGLIGQYAHGNEPSHHIAYLYAYAGQQWKTAEKARYIMKEFYHDKPDGVIGNEDCGQMSAWYVFSSLGFYPVFPASCEYVIGSPLFDKATINLPNGKQFTVETINNSDKNIYVQSIELNGKAYSSSNISHQDILNGGTMKIQMGDKPNYEFGKTVVSEVMKEEKGEFLQKPFVHPGMAQSKKDMDYMKQQVLAGKEPWKTAFENLKKKASLNFQPKPFTHISVGPYGANSIGGSEYGQSADAAYSHALMWYITGDKAYAAKAIEIINAWSYRLWDFDANNAKLNVGLSGPSFLNAAEILKYTDSGWDPKDIDQFKRLVLTVFYPTIKDFFTEANGNWDASMINTMLCIGTFTDNHEIFNRAVERFYRGEGNSGITKYIYPNGQCQETTRDWDHVQLGIGEFAKAAQSAWTQGLDLYSVADDRLALGFEYASKFMLGGDIPVFGILSQRKKDKFKDAYESIYDHYKSVKNIELKYTGEVIEKNTRPGSSIGFLTSVRAPFNKTQQKSNPIVPNKRAADPLRTGALKAASVIPSKEIVVIQPGESIQKAIDANAGTGKWIVLAKGVHTLKEPLKMKSSITLAGQGRESILFMSPELNMATIIHGSEDMHDVAIRDLLIEGATKVIENEDPNADRRNRSYMSAPSREGILFSGDKEGQFSNLLFENLTVQNCTKNGVSVRGANNVKVLNCDFSDNGSSVVPGAGFHHNLHFTRVSNGEIKNSRFDTSPWGNGISLTFCQNIDITGNEAARNKLSGISCAESENIRVINNLVEGNDVKGISFEMLMDGSRNVKVEDNFSQNNGKE